jgi:uncharacterized membrane protein
MRRVDAFSDAVFAIAITLLVLELPFGHVAEGTLAHSLGENWPRFVAYFGSFLSIGLAWIHHHAVFDQIARVTRPLLLLNLVALMTIAFIPFPTGLLGEYLREAHDDARTAALLYSGTWALASFAMGLVWAYVVSHPELLRPDVDREAARRLLRVFQGTVVVYVAFTLVAAFSPIASIVLYAPAALWFLWRSDYRALGREPE